MPLSSISRARGISTCPPPRSSLPETRRCCSPAPGWCRSSRFSWASRPRPPAGLPAARRASAPQTSTKWAITSTSPSSRCWAISVSETTLRRAPSASPGSWLRNSSASLRIVSTSPFTLTTTRPMISGTTRSASRPNASTATGTRTTGGDRPEPRAPPAPALRSTTTVASRRAATAAGWLKSTSSRLSFGGNVTA